jgi:hypothetical protein
MPSDYNDGLSFGRGSSAGRPFTATGFEQVTLIDEPYDRIEFDKGKILVGSSATFKFVITETMPIQVAYLEQRPRRPVAEESTFPFHSGVGFAGELTATPRTAGEDNRTTAVCYYWHQAPAGRSARQRS